MCVWAEKLTFRFLVLFHCYIVPWDVFVVMVQERDEHDPGGEPEDGHEVVGGQSCEPEGLGVGNKGESDPGVEQGQRNGAMENVSGEEGLEEEKTKFQFCFATSGGQP